MKQLCGLVMLGALATSPAFAQGKDPAQAHYSCIESTYSELFKQKGEDIDFSALREELQGCEEGKDLTQDTIHRNFYNLNSVIGRNTNKYSSQVAQEIMRVTIQTALGKHKEEVYRQ